MKIRDAPSPIIAAGPMLVGAAPGVAAVFLEWFEVTGEPGSLSVKAIDSKAETAAIILCCGLIAAFAIVMLARARKKGGRA